MGDSTINRKNLDINTHQPISSSVELKENMDEAQSSMQNEAGEDRDTPKRKLEEAQLAADDGSSKKMFLGETVSSASNDHVIERNTSDDRLTKEGEALHKSESSPNKKEINKNSMSEENRVIYNKSNDAIGVNE